MCAGLTAATQHRLSLCCQLNRPERMNAYTRQLVKRAIYRELDMDLASSLENVATARKLLEWIYHILKDGKSFHEVKKVVEAMGRGEPGNSSGNVK